MTEQNQIYRPAFVPVAEQCAEHDASEALQREGTLARLIASGLFCLLITFAWLFFAQLAEVLLLWLLPPANTDLTLFFIIFRITLLAVGLLLLILPVWLGRLRLAGLLLRGEEPELRELFYYFGSPVRYGRALRIGAVTVIQVTLPVLICAVAFQGVVRFYEALLDIISSEAALWVLILVVLGALQAVLVLILLSGVWIMFAAVAVGNEELPLRIAMRRALSCGRNLGPLFCFTLRWLWRMMLSLFTVGVLFILRYSHKYLLSYLRLAEALCPKGEN